VESACAVLWISPSTYYAAKKRAENPSARDEHDEGLKMAITRAREKKGGVFTVPRRCSCDRDGIEVARCAVERLMREMSLERLLLLVARSRADTAGGGPRRADSLIGVIGGNYRPSKRPRRVVPADTTSTSYHQNTARTWEITLSPPGN
jgi:hypothetical protein